MAMEMEVEVEFGDGDGDGDEYGGLAHLFARQHPAGRGNPSSPGLAQAVQASVIVRVGGDRGRVWGIVEPERG